MGFSASSVASSERASDAMPITWLAQLALVLNSTQVLVTKSDHTIAFSLKSDDDVFRQARSSPLPHNACVRLLAVDIVSHAWLLAHICLFWGQQARVDIENIDWSAVAHFCATSTSESLACPDFKTGLLVSTAHF